MGIYSVIIDVRDVRQEKGSKKLYFFSENISIEESDFTVSPCFDVEAEASDTVKTIHVCGTIKAEVPLDCARCLKNFSYLCDTSFCEEFIQSDIKSDLISTKVGEDQDFFFYRGNRLDLTDAIRQNFLASLPYSPLCSPDCKGLCDTCGTDLNVDQCRCEQYTI